MEYVKANLFMPGKVENYNLIIDLYNIGVTQAPITVIKALLGVLQQNYRCMSRKLYVFNVCWSLRMGWKVIDIMLSESTRQKIEVHGANTCDGIKDKTELSNIEKQYGGSADDCTVFWPPIMPEQ